MALWLFVRRLRVGSPLIGGHFSFFSPAPALAATAPARIYNQSCTYRAGGRLLASPRVNVDGELQVRGKEREKEKSRHMSHPSALTSFPRLFYYVFRSPRVN